MSEEKLYWLVVFFLFFLLTFKPSPDTEFSTLSETRLSVSFESVYPELTSSEFNNPCSFIYLLTLCFKLLLCLKINILTSLPSVSSQLFFSQIMLCFALIVCDLKPCKSLPRKDATDFFFSCTFLLRSSTSFLSRSCSSSFSRAASSCP